MVEVKPGDGPRPQATLTGFATVDVGRKGASG
jgi:hypothetical protein